MGAQPQTQEGHIVAQDHTFTQWLSLGLAQKLWPPSLLPYHRAVDLNRMTISSYCLKKRNFCYSYKGPGKRRM